jgi:hypothetical protein
MVDESGIQNSGTIIDENGLAVINMRGANVDQPCQPKTGTVLNPLEVASGKDFQQVGSITAKKTRPKAHAGNWPFGSLFGLGPAFLVLV